MVVVYYFISIDTATHAVKYSQTKQHCLKHTRNTEGPSCGLIMTGRRGWLVGAGHRDPSLTRFSDVKTFNGLFLYEAGP
jgi:hypothetical protein